MKGNIEYSDEWLLKEILKLHDEELKGKTTYIRMKKKDLLELVRKFIKLNKKGELWKK
mgnify:CR=1 FL=1